MWSSDSLYLYCEYCSTNVNWEGETDSPYDWGVSDMSSEKKTHKGDRHFGFEVSSVIRPSMSQSESHPFKFWTGHSYQRPTAFLSEPRHH